MSPSRRSLILVICSFVLAAALLVPSPTHASPSGPSPTPSPSPPAGPPSEARLRELASQYADIEFNADYTGRMPATEAEAVAMLEVLADIRDELEAMPSSVPPASHDPTAAQSLAGDFVTLGERWQSCDAPIGPIISILSWFRVRHTVKVTHQDEKPWNITSVRDHSTVAISSGITIGGILVQVYYDEQSKYVTGPDYRWVVDLGALKAFWTLWSHYHVHFAAGPFTYSKYDVRRGCDIA